MTKRATGLTGEEAKHYLCDCNSEQCFWVNNGPVLKNLDELAAAIKTITDEQFTHHVTSDRNDFSKWIAEVIGDMKLSRELSKVRSRTMATRKITERLSALRKAAS
ncbi:hypothetical protein HYU15_03815 [Candidatus Woesearchaeota archaeon]|nr:hypothetical protein [Candidatus Woesearchaeota archaeon]